MLVRLICNLEGVKFPQLEKIANNIAFNKNSISKFMFKVSLIIAQ